MMISSARKPIHPGEILLAEFMQPLGLSQNALGRALKVSPRRINELVHGERQLTADTAARLARYFGTSAKFWLGLQMQYDLEVLEATLGPEIARQVRPRQADGAEA